MDSGGIALIGGEFIHTTFVSTINGIVGGYCTIVSKKSSCLVQSELSPISLLAGTMGLTLTAS